MQLRRSNSKRASSRRNRHTSSKDRDSTTTKGSMASSFLALMRSPNFCSRMVAMSGAFIVCLSCLGRGGEFLGAPGKGVLLLHGLDRIGIVQLRRQEREAGARRNRHVQRLAFRQVLHGP